MNHLSFAVLLFCFLISQLQAQDAPEPMRVIHCNALNQQSAVQNIHVDDNNTKWIATSEGLFEIYSADNAGKIDDTGKWMLLRQRAGNARLELSENNDALQKTKAAPSFSTQKDTNLINATFFDKKQNHLWVGTTEQGVYCFKVRNNDLRILLHFDASNSRLQSNHINTIFVDRYERVWVGTDAGVLMGNDGKWRLYESYSNVFSIVSDKSNVWIMGDDYLWKVDENNRWMLDEMDSRLSKGRIRQIAYDSQGKLWVASDIITRFDVLNDKVEVYDASNGFTANTINCISVDKDDALWVGTEEGLFLIEREATMTISCMVEKPLSCAGTKDDAALLVKVFGGTPPYQYVWDAPLRGPNPQNVGPGLFTVTVTDADGITKKAGAKIEDNRVLVDLVSSADARNGKKNGQAEIAVSGGKPPYTYKWDSGETGSKAKRLAPGTNLVEVSDQAGCVIDFLVEIGGAPVATLPASDLSIDFDITNAPTCGNEKSASIAITVAGGTPPYTYRWNIPNVDGAIATDVGAGNYTVTVTDAAGKAATQNIYLEAPEPILAAAFMEQAVTGNRRRDGEARASAKGGIGDYTYAWSNGATGALATKLVTGDYTVTVTDTGGCTATASVQVTKQINMALAGTKNYRKGQIIQLDKLFFEADSTQVSITSVPTLQEIVKFMENNPKISIEVGGHTNGVPPHEYCDKLSSERAKSVADYLVARGVAAQRVRYKGYGKRKPIASNNTASGRQKNQRVEVKILDTGS